jgi:hypothetical protein
MLGGTVGLWVRVGAALACGAVMGTSPSSATIVPGGGTPANDCDVVLNVTGGARSGTTTVTCVDGDPACDQDGVCGNDACTFAAQVCVNQPGVPGCAPAASLDVVTLRSDLFPIPSSLVGAQCGTVDAQAVHVRVHRGRKKPGKVVVKALGKAPRGTHPRVDHDKYVLVCAPRADTCPSTTTTTTTMVTTTTLAFDMYVMLDQSGSMGDQVGGGMTKFDAVTSALHTFAQQPGAAGVGLGIQYFGLAPTLACSTMCNVDGDCGPPGCGPCDTQLQLCLGGGLGDSCTASDYATPDVEIATLPGVTADLAASFATHAPGTGAATSAALQGAVDHATAWATAHPDHAVVDVLITDSDPGECDTVLGDVTAIAAQGAAATPAIRTYVIAIGTSLTSPDPIAAAGGTSQAFVVDTSLNVSQQVQAALGAITGR